LNNNGIRLNHNFTTADYSELSFSSNGSAGNGASIRSHRSSENFTGNEGDLRFFTNTGSGGASSDGSEAMRIDSAGNVGINTTSPSGGRLVIAQANSVQPAIHLPTDESTIQGPNPDTQIKMGGNLVLQSGNQTSVFAKNASGIIVFGTGATPTERARIDSSGNVGIGTTSPDAGAKLTVAGAVIATGAFSATTGSTAGFDYFDGALRLFAMGTSGATKGAYTFIAKGADGSSSTPMTIDSSGNVAVTGALSSTGAIAIGNTVNTVSPTSPNRTITMVIGGTTYYIHAKTTND
jgi:hypothetical protein